MTTGTQAIHYTPDPHPDTRVPDPHQDVFSRVILGFWIYLMTDCLLFGTLFSTYAVLHSNTFGGPTSKEIFNLGSAFIESILLLLSSFTCGLALLAAVKNKKKDVLFWLSVSFFLGASFILMEAKEFSHLIREGNSWARSAFLSSFFSLVGTHGLHVSIGLLWILVLIAQIFMQGVTIDTFRRLIVFGMFWHFLDLVWIFIFTFVYLRGVL